MNRRAMLLATLASPALAQSLGAQGETVAPGWRMDTLFRWGDGVLPDAPAWTPGTPSAEAVAGQFGWDARVVAALDPPSGQDGVQRLTLVVAHPTVDATMAFPDSRDRPEIAALMQGASIINLERRGGAWIPTSGGFQARRLSGATLCRAAGPGAAALGGAITGLFGVSGGAEAPGGRLLLAEGEATDWTLRLPGRIGRGHGWVVELNPADPSAIPAKRTALGRGAVDVAATTSSDGRAVIYLAHPAGLARFISSRPAADPDALDQGTLSAARLGISGGAWVPLPEDAWQDMAAALAAAEASVLAAEATLHYALGTLHATTPRAGIITLRGDPAGPTISQSGVGNAASGSLEALPDAASRLWIGMRNGSLIRGARPVMTAPRSATTGGLALSPDGTTLFTAIRAPGREAGRSFARPATRWPDFTPGVPPRSAVVALTAAV